MKMNNVLFMVVACAIVTVVSDCSAWESQSAREAARQKVAKTKKQARKKVNTAEVTADETVANARMSANKAVDQAVYDQAVVDSAAAVDKAKKAADNASNAASETGLYSIDAAKAYVAIAKDAADQARAAYDVTRGKTERSNVAAADASVTAAELTVDNLMDSGKGKTKHGKHMRNRHHREYRRGY